ncbi:MAG: hypothetical protein ACE5FU_08710 [Nitrospinota bacterium]
MRELCCIRRTVLNDTRSNASDPGDISSISGSLDYLGDKDWYRVSVPANQTGPSVIYLEFDDSLTSDLDYLVRLVDPDDNVLLSHVFRGRSGRYSTRIKVPPGDNYFVVEPAGGEYITEKAPYSASITIVSDADEGEGVGNDINDAVMVKSGEPVTGKIAFRGDEDWYKVSVDRTNAQILELFFDAGISDAEYDVQIMRDDVVKRVFDANGGDSPTSLSTSIFIPADGTSGNATYLIKVADYQGDNGDNVQYTLQVNLVSVPGSLPAPASSGHVGAFYYHEVDERQDSTRSLVDLISNAITRKDFPVNTTLLDPSSDKAIITPAKGGTSAKTTIEFPWIAGYVDYQGDQDWFQLPNSPFYEGDTKWYYDIKVDIHADAPGSVVEYVWRFYPDRNNNRRLMLGYSTSSDDGIIASAGDLSTEREGLDVSVPGDGQKFWVGDKWEGNSFFSISDFNYAGTPGQEDDWGYDVPYYFKVTLTYYPGKSYPGDE